MSSYPNAQIEETEEHNIFNPVGKITSTSGGEISLKKEYAYPIATFKDTKRDAMPALINAMSTLGSEDGAAVQILLRPAKEGWEKQPQSVASNIKKNKGKKSGLSTLFSTKDLATVAWKVPEASETKQEDKQLSNLEQNKVDTIEQKTRYPGFEVLIRVVTSSDTGHRSETVLNDIVSVFSLFESQGMNGFSFSPAKDIQKFATGFILRIFPQESDKNILNSVELATLYHFTDQQFTPSTQVNRQSSKQVDGPSNMPRDGLLLGYNMYRGLKKEIRLSQNDRRRHTYVIGQTGTGKSVLLENLAIQDMLSGRGFAFIDPHGDSAETLLSMVPKSRTEDVIYFNPGDMDNPLGLNIFEYDHPDQKDFLIQEAINMLYKLYDPQHQGIIGPRYEHLFRNAALTVMADPAGGTFIDIPKLFNDPAYVRDKLKHVKDQTVLDFWQKEMPQSQRSNEYGEVISWFVSKFGAFLSNEMMRNIIGQTKSSFNLRDIMDNNKILLVNLSKGRVGELNSMLLGMIFVMKFQAAAMSRSDVPEDEREDFSVFVDEFQNFSTDSFATILSEARKYRLNLIVANQFIGQLTEEVRDAVFGNVGTILSLRSGAGDADFLVKQFSPTFDTQDIVKVPNFNAIVRLMIGGVPSAPFSMATIPPLAAENKELAVAIKQLSAAKFGKPRRVVEQDIFKRLQPSKSPAGAGFSTGGPSGPPSRPGSSSFLDDWLAKRQQQQSSAAKKSSSSNNPAQPTVKASSPAVSESPTAAVPTSTQVAPGQLLTPEPKVAEKSDIEHTTETDHEGEIALH